MCAPTIESRYVFVDGGKHATRERALAALSEYFLKGTVLTCERPEIERAADVYGTIECGYVITLAEVG